VSSFNWVEFLELAEGLAKLPTSELTECKRRVVAGRAYYATYNRVRAYAAAHRGIVLSKTDSAHTQLWNFLAGANDLAKLGNLGRQLMMLRRHADYDAAPPFTTANMLAGLHGARNAGALLDAAIAKTQS
jgi:hypothetical protein